MLICTYTHTYIHTHTHMYTHIHTYTHTHIHTYTHTHIATVQQCKARPAHYSPTIPLSAPSLANREDETGPVTEALHRETGEDPKWVNSKKPAKRGKHTHTHTTPHTHPHNRTHTHPHKPRCTSHLGLSRERPAHPPTEGRARPQPRAGGLGRTKNTVGSTLSKGSSRDRNHTVLQARSPTRCPPAHKKQRN